MKGKFEGNEGQPDDTVEGYFSYEDEAMVSKEKLEFLKSDLEIGPGASVLDVGCGRGTLVKFMRKHGYKVTGIDPTLAFVEWANSPHVKQGWAEDLPFQRSSFDAVHCAYVLEWMWRDKDVLYKALSEMHKVVKPGRIVFFSVLRPDTINTFYSEGKPYAPWWYEWMDVLRGFSLAQFSSDYGTYFFKLRKV